MATGREKSRKINPVGRSFDRFDLVLDCRVWSLVLALVNRVTNGVGYTSDGHENLMNTCVHVAAKEENAISV